VGAAAKWHEGGKAALLGGAAPCSASRQACDVFVAMGGHSMPRNDGLRARAASLRARAKEILARAETMDDAEARLMMREVASSYESLALRVENEADDA
jgi:hypothetical protein